MLVKALSSQQQSPKTVGVAGEEPSKTGAGSGSNSVTVTSLAGPMLKLLASMVSTLAPCNLEPVEPAISLQVTDAIR